MDIKSGDKNDAMPLNWIYEDRTEWRGEQGDKERTLYLYNWCYGIEIEW